MVLVTEDGRQWWEWVGESDQWIDQCLSKAEARIVVYLYVDQCQCCLTWNIVLEAGSYMCRGFLLLSSLENCYNCFIDVTEDRDLMASKWPPVAWRSALFHTHSLSRSVLLIQHHRQTFI